MTDQRLTPQEELRKYLDSFNEKQNDYRARVLALTCAKYLPALLAEIDRLRGERPSVEAECHIACMQAASIQVDAAAGTPSYHTALIALGLLAREYLRLPDCPVKAERSIETAVPDATLPPPTTSA
jgi:hypothetical protein